MDIPGFHIRPARASDIQALASLAAELFSIEKDFAADFRKQAEGYILLLSNPERARVLVAEKDGKVVGMATAQLLISTAEGGISALVEDVVVTGQERGRGAGKALLDGLGSWAVSKKARRMQLLADRENTAALLFYEKQGWAPTRMAVLRKFPG
jgi:GNAT superfamily N-acetyltransferase